jgi:hypothetical protein
MAEIKDFSTLDEQVRRGLAEQQAAVVNGGVQRAPPEGDQQGAVAAGGSEAEDFRAVAPPVMSFAAGRRR